MSLKDCGCFDRDEKGILLAALEELRGTLEKHRQLRSEVAKSGGGFSKLVDSWDVEQIEQIDKLTRELEKMPPCTPAMKGKYMTPEEAETWRTEQFFRKIS